MVTEHTRKLLGDAFAVRRLSKVRVVNIGEPVDLFEVTPVVQGDLCAVHGCYEQALQQLEDREVAKAAQILSGLVTEHGLDGANLFLLSRVAECLVEPSKWKLVWDLPGK